MEVLYTGVLVDPTPKRVTSHRSGSGLVVTANHPDVWGDLAAQSPSDWGPLEENGKQKLKRILTSKVNGRVLEAMCGFRSYIYDCEGIEEVVALDFSEEALERYGHPNRRKVPFDLNNLRWGAQTTEFPDGYFDSVCITFGVNYLDDPSWVYREFGRVTNNRGKLLIVGNPNLGYRSLETERFNPKRTAQTAYWAGFRDTKISRLPIEMGGTRGKYYLVEASKPT